MKISKLQQVASPSELAQLLNIPQKFFLHHLYGQQPSNQYKQWTIPKKNGSLRSIASPQPNLKLIQSRLAEYLQDCLQEIRSQNNFHTNLSHGFEIDKSIITNAAIHEGQKYILNIDLENFFDSINFGRIRGFFIKNKNFKLHPSIASCIAHIACFNNSLPQGSPSSPVISNLICSVLDIRLKNFAKRYKCLYTRYADDLTFSTYLKYLPEQIAKSHNYTNVELSTILINEIRTAGFTINSNKTRLQHSNLRQEVTGITVNKKLSAHKNYRNLCRAKAHHLFSHGYFNTMDKSTSLLKKGSMKELEGQLAFIDSLDKYNRKANKISIEKNKRENLFGKFIFFKNFLSNERTILLTEGKTDIQHLKCALIGLELKQLQSTLQFYNHSNSKTFLMNKTGQFNFVEGSNGLKTFIRDYEEIYTSILKGQFTPPNPVIIISDNDHEGKKIQQLLSNKFQKTILNDEPIHIIHNLYIIFLPAPPHLSNKNQNIEIEDLYPKSILATRLNGKTFNRTNHKSNNNQYGKDSFVNKVIKSQINKLSFHGFKKIFRYIEVIQTHYKY